jgi:hypothetical protein
MNLQALIVGAFGITIFLAVLTEGMVITRADIVYLFSRPERLVRTILAMNVLGPIIAIIVCRFFALHPAVIVALVTLSRAGYASAHWGAARGRAARGRRNRSRCTPFRMIRKSKKRTPKISASFFREVARRNAVASSSDPSTENANCVVVEGQLRTSSSAARPLQLA